MLARLFAVSVVALVVAPAAFAAEGKKAPDQAKIFARKDANSDGALTLDEFKAGMKDKAVDKADRRFKKIDSNSDGKLSLDEFKAGMPAKKS
jgi:Ca2+-binding EF-hand superfamily protein